MRQQTVVSTIRFDAMPCTIDKSTILRLPKKASRKLPSRGQVAVQGTINGRRFQTVLEPDGNFGHWMKIDRKMQSGKRRPCCFNLAACTDPNLSRNGRLIDLA